MSSKLLTKCLTNMRSIDIGGNEDRALNSHQTCDGRGRQQSGWGRGVQGETTQGGSGAMKQKWGREGYAGHWPSDRRVWTIAAFFVALLSVVAIYAYHYEPVWTPLQRFYLGH